jgi:hypothetical protein
MSTNSPNISIHHSDNSVFNLGSNWLTPIPVHNNDIWTINYPCTDDQLGNTTWGPADPVVINGLYKMIDSNGVTMDQMAVWIRLPRGYSGGSWQFYIDPATPYQLHWQCLTLAPVCAPSPDSGSIFSPGNVLAFRPVLPRHLIPILDI